MKTKYLIVASLLISNCMLAQQKKETCNQITINPLNLNYRFYTEGVSHRTAADPVIVLYKDRYYLFASHSSGYWHSTDLKEWTYVASNNLKTVEAWAPAVIVYKEAIYYLGMGEKQIYRSCNPAQDEWEKIDSKVQGYGDPAFFQDNDGRVYLYYGCSDNAPIKGFEVDPADGFKPITPEKDLIPHNADQFGWEVPGERNEMTDKRGWNEAPCITRQGDYYYLQYSAPGTEFTTYCTGIYIAKNPLGPYSCMKGAPFSIKPGGFITGAGHGHPFKDRHGNDWYVGTMIVSDKEHFERRIGIFPAFYQNEYAHGITDYTDFPFVLPDRKVDFSIWNTSAQMNLLSFHKSMKASSSYPSHEPEKASDENIKTNWSATSGTKGEWLQMDLGRSMKVSAVQVCFADEGFQTYRRDGEVPVYQYIIECSNDGKQWKKMSDRSKNTKDQIYELITLKKPMQTRFIRVMNMRDFRVGRFSIVDLRLFGEAEGKKPDSIVGLQAERRTDRRRIAFSWNPDRSATGYVIRWGTDSSRINNAAMIYGNQAEFGFFDRDLPYYITIEAFNESGIGKRSQPIRIN